jgi:hypothetical protein
MTAPSSTCQFQGCKAEVPPGFFDQGLCVDHYLARATEKLNAVTQTFRVGRNVDNEILDWLLAQVDFVVETIGDETVSLREDERTNLLELLLGIANFNEHIRRFPATLQATR